MLFDRLYVIIGVLHASGKYSHDYITSLRCEVLVHKASVSRHISLKYQARKVSSHVFVF